MDKVCYIQQNPLSTQLKEMQRVAVLLGFAVLQPTLEGRIVTITNDIGRRDVHGDYLDAHDGKIVVVNGTYYLYGAFNPLDLILKLHQRALVWHLATFGGYIPAFRDVAGILRGSPQQCNFYADARTIPDT